MKYFIKIRHFVVFFGIMLLLSSCSAEKNDVKSELDDHTYSTYYAEIQYEEKTNLMELIMKEEKLIPGENLEWLMSKEKFLQTTYRADVLDPESENYEEHRNNEMPNGMISLLPPTAVQLKDVGLTATTTYLFSVDEELVTVVYRAQCSAQEIDKYGQILEDLIQIVNENEQLLIEQQTFQNVADNENEPLVIEQKTFQNISDVDLQMLIKIKWTSLDGSTFFQMNSVYFGERFLLDLIVSMSDAI